MLDPMTRISGHWADIAAWLAEHAPATLAAVRPPTGAQRLAAAEATVGFPLGPELSAWWSCHDGADSYAGEILPGYLPYGLDDMLRSRQLWLQIADDVWDDAAKANSLAQGAGGLAWPFLPVFVPIATNGAGDDLFVDLRPGARRGCLKVYAHDEGALAPPPYPGLAELLADVNTALRTGAPVLRRTPAVESDRLTWLLSGAVGQPADRDGGRA
jgi:cell wall assembly regulator SMI1